MKAKYQTSPFVFTGNPIVLESEGYFTDSIKGGRFTVSFEGRRIYEGRFFAPLDIDISEIVDSVSEFLPEPSGDSDNPWELIESIDPNSAANNRRKVNVLVEYNFQDDETYEMVALPGGIPAQQFRTYAMEGKDVFESRLYGQGCNLFFTSRTSGWRVEMKETEIYPLYFIAPRNLRIKFRGALSNFELGYDLPIGICTLDPSVLREEMMLETNMLENVFDIYLDYGSATVFGCQLVITHSEPALERYRLKFRNSFGVFEIMEISGKLMESTDYSAAEENSYRKLDPVTRRYSTLRSRLETTRSFTTTTPLPRERGGFMADLLASEEIYLLDAFKTPVRVNVSAEEFSRQRRQDTPETITLKIEMVDSDLYIGEEISGINDSRRPRVHTKQFNNKFN